MSLALKWPNLLIQFLQTRKRHLNEHRFWAKTLSSQIAKHSEPIANLIGFIAF